MRAIRIIAFMSLDGIIQAPGGPEEDRDGFDHGGWLVPFFDDELGKAVDAAQGAGFDLLLGRRTYDIFAGHWPKITDDPMADMLNAATKHVATTRPDSLDWGPVKAVGSDLAADLRRIKAEPGPDLVVWGSSTLISELIGHGLVDELHLFVFPVLLGTGKRLFRDGAGARELALAETRTTPSGAIITRYRPVGPVRTGSFEASAA